jgi:hypothetical protein
VTVRVLASMFVLALTGASCASSSGGPTAPTPSSRTGIWTGTVSDSANGTGTLRLVLEDRAISANESFLTGSWTTTFDDAAKNSEGTFAGGINGTRGFLSLGPSRSPACPSPPAFGTVGTYIAAELTVETNAIRGSYLFAACSGSVSGTLEVRR